MSTAEPRSHSHVEALIRARCPGVSIKELERRHGVQAGGIANLLKPSRGARFPRLDTIERLAAILGLDTAKVFHAFALDAGLGAPDLTDTELDLVARFRRLGEQDQSRALALISALETVAHTLDGHAPAATSDQV
ncbi:helix-turn-helix transcriptional regulator [Actinokineospora terrae]|uniref:HTH cro/C1-type domain-containing protein n=1 Tax=Actinokineospora terrae TaxID=155974 RepID=A0A1H9XSJ8_9PSEU|nr:helix-turn-helix transcriptional regulator [Actinokineospora terrae]SES49134.1 hypothetical protein SAMN04487818_12441 [Actinokineospora terrae]